MTKYIRNNVAFERIATGQMHDTKQIMTIYKNTLTGEVLIMPIEEFLAKFTILTDS